MNESGGTLTVIRRLGYGALLIGFAQIVFGAIVRLTGSGLGCGDHWPDCYGSYTPGNRGLALLIEISHRYGAALLSLTVLALFLFCWRERRQQVAGSTEGVFAPSAAALALVLVAAVFGAVTVKLELAPLVVATHLAIAMALLAVLVELIVRAGGFGARSPEDPKPASRSHGPARAALGLAFVTLIFGALTANWLGAPIACRGFPWCRTGMTSGSALWIQLTHRVLALLLFGHLLGMMLGARRREPGSPVARAATWAFAIVVLQVLVAAALVESGLPLLLRSAHQAVGTLLWISIAATFSLAGPRRAVAVGFLLHSSRASGRA